MRNIHDLPIIPYIIADRAAWNAMEADSRFDSFEPAECAEIASKCEPLLVSRAQRHYRDNDHFAKQLQDKRNNPRYTLETFMEHWCKKLLVLYLSGKELKFERDAV